MDRSRARGGEPGNLRRAIWDEEGDCWTPALPPRGETKKGATMAGIKGRIRRNGADGVSHGLVHGAVVDVQAVAHLVGGGRVLVVGVAGGGERIRGGGKGETQSVASRKPTKRTKSVSKSQNTTQGLKKCLVFIPVLCT